LLAVLQKKLNIFSQIWWKGGTQATEKPQDFGGNLDHIILELGYRLQSSGARMILHMAEYVNI